MNFVRLDFDRADDSALAQRLGVRLHPAYAFVSPDGAQVAGRAFGPLEEGDLRGRLDALILAYRR